MVSVISKKKKDIGAVFGVGWQIAKLIFIPHQGNNYKPHIIRHYGLVLLLLTVAGLQFGYNVNTTGDVLGVQSNITINSLLESTNKSRSQHGEAPLRLNSKLNEAAYFKVTNMFAEQYWAHNSPSGTTPWKWLGDVGYNYNEAGENLAKNFTNTDALMLAWLNSPEHRANILKADYQDVGFAIFSGTLDNKPTSMVVALYGLSADVAVAGAQSGFSSANPTTNLSTFDKFVVGIKSITPAAVVGLILILISIGSALLAHTYRRKLPKALRKSWYRHHGLYKAIGLTTVGIIMVFIYNIGQL